MKQEVHFKNIQSKISELLDTAEFDIKIAVAWFTDEYLIRKLEKLAKAGVNITIIFYDDRINNKDLFKELYHLNCKIYLSKKLMHNKFCVIDDDIVINGSYNWTYSAHTNDENITVAYSNIEFAENFAEEFKKLTKSCDLIDLYFKQNTFDSDFELYYENNKTNYELPFFVNHQISEYQKPFLLIDTEEKKENILWVLEYKKHKPKKKDDEFEKRYKSLLEYSFDKVNFIDFEENIGYFKNDECVAEIYNERKYSHKGGKAYLIKKNNFNLKNYIGFNEYYREFYREIITSKSENTHKFYNNKLKLKYEFSGKFYFLESIIVAKKNGFYGAVDYNSNEKVKFIYQNYLLKENSVEFKENPFIVFRILEGRILHFSTAVNGHENFYKIDKYNLNGDLISSSKFSDGDFEIEKGCFFIYKSEIKKCLIYNDKYISNSSFFDTIYRTYVFEKLEELLKHNERDLIYNIEENIKNRKYHDISMRAYHKNRPVCYVATMAYGDINHPKVQNFRDFRDDYLVKTGLGNLFIKYYYKYSPSLVRVLEPYKKVNKTIRFVLDILNFLIPKNK